MNSTKNHLKYFGFRLIGMLALPGLLFMSPVAYGNPQSSDGLQEALNLIKSEQWQAAIPALQKALAENPQNSRGHANLGVALSRVNRHKEALFSYEKARSLGYDNAQFRYYQGLSLAKINLLEDAVEEFETALKMDSRLTYAYYDLGILYNKLGRHTEARKQIKKLYKKNRKLSKKLFDQTPRDYQIMSVDHGGILSGTVSLSGRVPKPRAFHLIHAPNVEYCSRISDGKGNRILYDFSVSEAGGLQDTVVVILGIKKGKPFPQKMKVLHLDRCRSDQYVIGIKNGENILIENTDPIRHEIATYEIYGAHRRQTSNKQIVAFTSQVRSAFAHPETREFLIKCNLHPFLQTQGLMITNPYYAVSDSAGQFKIQDIPPGTYEVMAWHPFIPVQRGTVTIKSGQNAKIDFSFRGEDERRKLYQNDTEGYRFNTWFDSKKKFYGGKRVDDPIEILQEFDNSERYIGDLIPF